MTKRRILLTTGGTGGHIFPAIAVAEALRTLDDGVDLLFVGTDHGPEKRIASDAGLNFIGLHVNGVLGRGIKSLGAMTELGRSVINARRILKEFHPNVVAGFGSYASFPSLFAAKMAGIPIVVHEQNAIPGLSNRIMGRLAARIFLSMPDSLHQFAESKTYVVGNPVRRAITTVSTTVHNQTARPSILVMGGSQGAKSINSVIINALPFLTPDIFIHHQTGVKDFQRVKTAYEHAGLGPSHALVEPFITDMASVYRSTDLVLSRSGATTVAELALAGKPAILIPFPYATHNHQAANAKIMEQAGAARCIEEKELDSIDLPVLLNELLHDQMTLEKMGVSARSLAKPRAAEDVAKGILQLASRY